MLPQTSFIVKLKLFLRKTLYVLKVILLKILIDNQILVERYLDLILAERSAIFSFI